MLTTAEKILGNISKQYIESKQNIEIYKDRFQKNSISCFHRHPTALYSNCMHPKGDADMPNCLVDECPLKNEIT